MPGPKLFKPRRRSYKCLFDVWFQGFWGRAVKILFITSTRIGDAVLSTGLLDRLIADHPGARLTVACGPAAAPLFEAVPGLERIIVLDKMLLSLHWVRMWVLCIGQPWDLVVDLRNAPLSYLLRAKSQRHMHRTREPGHRVAQLARVLGLEVDPPAPKIWISGDNERTAETLIADGGPVLAVGPTANWHAKTWPADRFAELSRRLTGQGGILAGARIAVFGRADERPQAMRLIESIPEERRIDLVGHIGLLDVAACMKRCALYVGNDSGLMHLAAAAGIPTLGLFGPSPEEHYAPWGPRCAVVRTEKSHADIFPPDFDPGAPGSLMEGLSVDRAEQAVLELWRRTSEAAA